MTISPTPDGIPATLKDANRWLVWRTKDRDGKPNKVPYCAEDPAREADPTNQGSFASHEAAVEALNAHPDLDGLGFALGDGWAGVDLDDCRDPETGELADWALAIVDRVDSYTEVSPSGTGLKIFVRGQKPGPRCRTAVEDGEVELYDADRYFTVTGRRLERTPAEVGERTDALETVYRELFGAERPPERDQDDGPPAATSAARLTDEELLDRAREADNGDKFQRLYDEGDTSNFPSASEADASLCEMLAFWTGRDRERVDRLFRSSALMRDKWERPDYREDTLEKALAWCQDVYEPGDRVEDYWAYLPSHRYIYRPTRDLWPATSVNARVSPVPIGEDETQVANQWLDRHRAVQAMTWAPGEPEVIEGRICTEGGWQEVPGTRTYNLYRAPEPEPGDPADVDPWLEHVHKLYPDEADHLIHWFAHRVQHPGDKVNHAVVLGGGQGIGKDTALEPLRTALGSWNLGDIAPTRLLGQFNPWRRNVVLVISEARDLGEMNRWTLYEKTKTLTAAPPDVLDCNEKYRNVYQVPNVVGVVFTTNHRDGLYLPPDDRRHFVAWSELAKGDFEDGYFQILWSWYEDGGRRNVAAYLRELDLSQFDPKAPPPHTAGWRTMVGSHRPAEADDLREVLDQLNDPPALTKGMIEAVAKPDFHDWLRDRSNYRKFPHRLKDEGYVRIDNPDENRGRWKVDGRQTSVYARQDLTHRERLKAAEDLVREGTPETPF